MIRMAALLLPLCLALAGCDDGPAKPVRTGDPMPPFTATSVDGREFTFPTSAAGKVLVVRFWASWCAFCRGEMAAIEPVWQSARDRGLLVVAVNAGQEPDVVAKFASSLGITYPVLLDPGSRIARAYGVTGLPTTVFVDRRGMVRGRILGETDAATFRRMAEDLL